MARLADKICVITGAASGIGAEMARLFAAEGGTVIGVDLTPDTAGVLDESIAADVTDEASVAGVFEQIRDRHGRLDVLCNNAGISPPDDGSILSETMEIWDRVQDVNLRGVFLCCKYGMALMQDSGGGSVVNTASFVAVMGAATSQVSYTASKGAVLALSRELGVQFAKRDIRVNALCPGPVNTPLLRELFAKDPDQAERRLRHLPMGRFAEPREIAQAALFLASDDSSYVNASTFLVDGGLTSAYVTPE